MNPPLCAAYTQAVRSIAEVCGLAILLGLVALAAFHPLYAVDFFWHLELGEVIARTHSIPTTDLFSAAAPDRPYVQFNWLWELGAAHVVRAFGFRGVRVLQAVLMACSIGALYALARVHTKRPAIAFFAAALGFVWFEDRFQERPAALVLAFTVALAALVLRWRERGPRALAVIAVLGMVWSNLHGGESLLLPLTLLALVVGECGNRYLLHRAHTRIGPACAGLAIATLSLFASPTFYRGLMSWLGTIGQQVEAGNEEWQPAYTMLAQGLRPTFILVALGPTLVAVAYAVEQGWRRREGREIDVAEWCLCAGYLMLAHQAVRNVVLAIVPLLFMLGRTGLVLKQAPRDSKRLRVQRAGFALAAVALIASAAEDALVYSYADGLGLTQIIPFDLAPETFPELASDFAQEAKLQGGIANDGHWGGYLIYRLWPDCHVFADSRHHFTPDMWQVFRATHDALSRPAGLEYAFARYRTELTFFRGPTFPLGAPASYRLLYKAGDQEVYQDLRGPNAAANLERTRAWLSKQGVETGADPNAAGLGELARKLGAKRFLASSYQRLIRAKAERDVESRDAALRGRGHGALASQLYRAGEWSAAEQELTRALAELPNEPTLRYIAAQNSFAAGDYATARARLRALLAEPELAPRQRRRLAAMLEVAQKQALAPRAATP